MTLNIYGNSLNPITWMGLAYYDNLYIILPEFTINFFIYVFQSYITYILIFIIKKNLFSIVYFISYNMSTYTNIRQLSYRVLLF